MKKKSPDYVFSYFDIINAFWEVAVKEPEITTAEISVFMALLSHRNNKTSPYQCNPMQENILGKAKLGIRAVKLSISILKRHELIKSVRKRGNWYCFKGDPRFDNFSIYDTFIEKVHPSAPK